MNFIDGFYKFMPIITAFLFGIFFAFVLIFITSCTVFKDIPEDSWPEEIAEQIIEGKLGLTSGSIDLTPSSPEKR